jgi:glutaredoxin
MAYILFTYPNCPHCRDVKSYLNGREVKYEEVNAGLGEGKVKFRDFYSKNKDKIHRENDGTITLPILSSGEGVFQGLEDIAKNINL